MTINVERTGSGEPVVFVHGAGGNVQSWAMQKGPLGNRMEVMVAELPGHGRSPGEARDSITDYREVLYEALRELGRGPYWLVGHSMGGAIAMDMAVNRPEAVRGIVLVGTGARLKVLPEILEGVRRDKEPTVRKIIDYAFSGSAFAALKSLAYEEYMKNPREVIYKDFLACDRFDIRASLPAIACPALILCGSDDALTPPRYSEYLRDAITRSSLRIVAGAGHMVMLEQPAEVNDAIRLFVGV